MGFSMFSMTTVRTASASGKNPSAVLATDLATRTTVQKRKKKFSIIPHHDVVLSSPSIDLPLSFFPSHVLARKIGTVKATTVTNTPKMNVSVMNKLL